MGATAIATSKPGNTPANTHARTHPPHRHPRRCPSPHPPPGLTPALVPASATVPRLIPERTPIPASSRLSTYNASALSFATPLRPFHPRNHSRTRMHMRARTPSSWTPAQVLAASWLHSAIPFTQAPPLSTAHRST
eukprot:3321061-Pleurochrysis_carterae.AAC.1